MQVECGTIILIIWMFQIVFGKLITVNGKRFWIVLYVSLILFLACSFRNIFIPFINPLRICVSPELIIGILRYLCPHGIRDKTCLFG